MLLLNFLVSSLTAANVNGCNAAERDLQPPDRQAGAREGRPGGAEGGPEPGLLLIHVEHSCMHASCASLNLQGSYARNARVRSFHSTPDELRALPLFADERGGLVAVQGVAGPVRGGGHQRHATGVHRQAPGVVDHGGVQARRRRRPLRLLRLSPGPDRSLFAVRFRHKSLLARSGVETGF